jgi:multiple sugar transport system ATP-binding protein
MAEIRLNNINKNFGDFKAVVDSSLTIEDGEFFVLLGSSGCGKTTMLRMIAGLEMPSSGKLYLDGKDVTFTRASQRDIAFVFQLFALYPHMNVQQNLSFPLKTQNVPRAEIKSRMLEVARMLRIEHLLNRSVRGLSGGDRQRVALGRALIRRPKAFLMDEPIGTLDAEFREIMRKELRDLHERIGATTVYVTHDQIEAMSMGDRIAVMSHGKVLQVAPPMEMYNKPRTIFVANFIGSPSMNFLPFKGPLPVGTTEVALNGVRVKIPQLHEELTDGDYLLGARPENIQLTDKEGLAGIVFGVEYMGARKLITVDTDFGRVRVLTSDDQSVSLNENVRLQFSAEYLIIFNTKTELAVRSDLMREI